jgi:hypothetical protein
MHQELERDDHDDDHDDHESCDQGPAPGKAFPRRLTEMVSVKSKAIVSRTLNW